MKTDWLQLATGVDLATGVSSVSVRLTMNDGSVYSSAEGAEVHKVDDSIWVVSTVVGVKTAF